MAEACSPKRERRTIQNKIDELKSILRLKEFDQKAYYEWAEDVRRLNEDTILNLRQEVRNNRISLTESEKAEENVIQNAFQNRRQERLSLKRKTAAEAVIFMDQKVCEQAKDLNALRHARVESEKTLDCLRETLASMVKLEKAELGQLGFEQRIRSLENGLDKSRMKRDMATTVTQHYEFIAKKMKEESLQFPAILETLEQEISENREQLVELRKMMREAQKGRDAAKANLSRVEHESQTAKQEREQLLAETRKEVERRKESWEALSKKSAKVTLISEIQERRQDFELQQAEKLVLLNRRLFYEDLFDTIKDATGLTSLDVFIQKLENQDNVARSLTERAEYLRMKVGLYREKMEKLRETNSEQKYTGDQLLSRDQRALDEVKERLDEQLSRKLCLKSNLAYSGKLLVGIGTGLKNLIDKLKDVKLKPGNRNYSRGDVTEDLQLCTDKLLKLSEDVTASIAQLNVGDNIQDILHTPEFLEDLQNNLPKDNIRINLVESAPSVKDTFRYDNQDINEEMLSRNDIKEISQLIVDNQLKPKNRRKQKRR